MSALLFGASRQAWFFDQDRRAPAGGMDDVAIMPRRASAPLGDVGFVVFMPIQNPDRRGLPEAPPPRPAGA